VSAVTDYAALSDPDLIAERSRLRAELSELPAGSDAYRTAKMLFDVATQEIDHRARLAWAATA
jgi:hypothetical protein